MSRSNGTYPVYEKINVDPEIWPKSYWNSSMVCEHCDINWPNEINFVVCPICKEDTLEADFRPTFRWPEAVTKLLIARFDEWYYQYDDIPENEVKEKFEEHAKAHVE